MDDKRDNRENDIIDVRPEAARGPELAEDARNQTPPVMPAETPEPHKAEAPPPARDSRQYPPAYDRDPVYRGHVDYYERTRGRGFYGGRRTRRRGIVLPGVLILAIIATVVSYNLAAYSPLTYSVNSMSIQLDSPATQTWTSYSRVSYQESAAEPIRADYVVVDISSVYYSYPELRAELTAAVTDVDGIIASLVSSDIYIYESTENEVKVRWYSDMDEDLQKTNIYLESSHIVLDEVIANSLFGAIISVFSGSAGAEYTSFVEVWVPSGFYNDLRVSSVDGFIYGSCYNVVFKDVYVDSVSGDISLDSIYGTASSAVSTTSGDINVNRLESQEGTVKSISGDIGIDTIKCGSLDVHTTSGDVSLSLGLTDSLKAASISGDVRVYDLSTGTISISTTSGEMYISDVGFTTLAISTVSGDAYVRGPKVNGLSIESNVLSGSVVNKTGLPGSDFVKVSFGSVSGSLIIE